MPHATSSRPDFARDTLPDTLLAPREYSRVVSRPTRADINLDALRHNAAQLASKLRRDAKLLAVLKADAYGHGAVEIARALTQTITREYSQADVARDESAENQSHKPSARDAAAALARENEKSPREYSHRDFSPASVAMLGVASVDEGAQLRDAAIETPILLLSAILPEEAQAAIFYNLTPTIFSEELARACNEAAKSRGKIADFHFKIDTGMNRLGVNHRDAAKLLERLREYSHLHLAGVYTHFACADEADETMTHAQAEIFEKTLLQCGLNAQVETSSRPLIHAANSAAAMRFSQMHFDLARTGIALYGVDPRENAERENEEEQSREYSLRPVMTLRSRVTHIKEIAAGETVSYGATWRAQKLTRLAIAPVGYADGYPRRASGKAQVLLNGARCEVAGRITMDQIIIDCSRAPRVQIGDDVIIFGQSASTRESASREYSRDESVSVSQVASWAQTISYEVLCGIAPRVPRISVYDAPREYSHAEEKDVARTDDAIGARRNGEYSPMKEREVSAEDGASGTQESSEYSRVPQRDDAKGGDA